MKEKSEFGKGLVICLVKFAEHAERLNDDLKKYKEMHERNPKLFFEQDAVHMWANGASDHLYEIECPDDWKDIKAKIEKMQELGLSMGHGFQPENMAKCTLENAKKLISMTRDVALMVDEKIGLKPDRGEW